MTEKILDCRGLACPNPVLKTKELADQGVASFTVLVDNAAAKENVSRFLSRAGFEVNVTQEGGAFAVSGTRAAGACEVMAEKVPEQAQKILVFLGADRLGRGDDELGRLLLPNFLGTLKEMGPELWCLILVNGGVKLTIEGSEVLDSLQELEKSGVMVLVCGFCLNFFNILEQKRVGETTNMLDIVTHMQLADKVISLT